MIKTQETQASARMYVIGFVLSIVLTLAAYFSVTHNLFSHALLVAVLVVLALTQFTVQLYFFLHLGEETKPRLKLWVLIFMIIIVGILVFGSLWIMNNLNYNMTNMTPQQEQTYLHDHEGL